MQRLKQSITVVLFIAALAWPSFAQKRVVCVAPGNQGFISNHEGFQRARPPLGRNDVIDIGGNLTNCLGRVANGDELVIIAHGNRGRFNWGGTRFTGFGGGRDQMPVPAGFNTLMNVTFQFCACFSAVAPEAGGGSMVDRLLAAMGGAARGHTGAGFNGPARAGVLPDLIGGTRAQRNAAIECLTNSRWRDNPPVNRPNTGTAERPNQESAANAVLTACAGAGGAVTLRIPNRVGRRRQAGPPVVPEVTGYPEPDLQPGAGGARAGSEEFCGLDDYEVVELPEGCASFDQPLTDYINRSLPCSLGAAGSRTKACTDSDGNPEATFSDPLNVRQVPQGWAIWSTPPESETATPMIGYTEGESLAITLSEGADTAGLEIEPHGMDTVLIEASFRDADNNELVNIQREVNGFGGARLFAATCDTPTQSIVITAYDAQWGFAVAQVRSNLFVPLAQSLETDAAPTLVQQGEGSHIE